MAAGPCPTPSVLEAFASAPRPDPAVRRHVDACDSCRAALLEIMENNRFLDGVGSAVMLTQHTSDDPPSRAPGDEAADAVPGYTLLEEIHRGGQGIVYRAIQNQTKRFVAIKMLLGGKNASRRQRERFEREARIAAALRHPNIVTVYDSGYLADGRFAFAMEFISGLAIDKWSRTLDQHSGRDGARRALRERMAVMAKVCDAVLCAHQHAVVHRDLKPGNILVDAKGEPHVLDFGIAKRYMPRGPEHETIIMAASDPLRAASQSHLTNPGEFAGTLAYAAPEQVAGDPERVDTRTDIYSLGVLMYDVVSGRLPYIVDCSLREAIHNIESAEPAPLGGRTHDPYGRWVDEDAATIILKAMSKDPARRYQTVAGLKRDIEHYLSGAPIDARRDSTWYVVRKNALRHKRLLAGGATIALAVILGAGAAGYGLFQARGARQREQVEKARATTVARAARVSGQLIQQTFFPQRVEPDDAALGRHVRRGLERLQVGVDLGVFAQDPDDETAARSAFTSIALSSQSLPLAEVSYRQAIATIYARHGENHPAMAEALHDLADVLLRRGASRLYEAETIAQRAVEICRRLFSADHPATASNQLLLARIVLARNDPAAAEAPCEESMQILRATADPDPSDFTQAALTLSEIRSRLGRFEEAEAAATEALKVCLESCGDDDPLFIVCFRRYAQAIQARASLAPDPAVAGAVGGGTRVAVAAGLSRAADNLGQRGMRPEEILGHIAGLQTVLALKQLMLGKDHLSAARTFAWLAADYRILEDELGIESAARGVIGVLEARLGRNHFSVVQPYEMLWSVLIAREDYAGAVEMRRRMLRIWVSQPPPARDNLWIANEHRWLAESLALAGGFEEAKEEYGACLDMLAASGLSDHYLADICTGGIGWAELHLGRPAEAEALVRRAIARYGQSPGAPPDQLAWLKRHLAHILIAEGKLDEAGPPMNEAWLALASPVGRRTYTSYCVLQDCIDLAVKRKDQPALDRFSSALDALRKGGPQRQGP